DILLRLNTFAQQYSNLGKIAILELFAGAYSRGELQIPDPLREIIGDTLSAATLARWQRAKDQQGVAALAGAYGNRAGTGKIESDTELRDFIIAMLVDRPHLGARQISRGLHGRFGDSKELPCLRSIERFLTRWKRENAQVFTAVANPDAWKNRYMVAHGRADEDVVRLNQRWEFDSTMADVMLTDGRHVIVQIVDVWSRRRMFQVSKSSSAEAICQTMRRCLMQWGVPEQVKLDNGQDYVSHRMQRVFDSLDCDVHLSAPFSPWQKPHVESGFKTFSHDLLEMLPGYSGHSVADAQELRARHSFADRLMQKNAVVEIKLDSAALQEFCDRWTRDVYEHEPRSGLDGMTVFQRLASWRGEVRRITDERTLDLLLAEAPDGHGGRTVGKKGIRVDGLLYIAPELGAFAGERVRVLYDPDDVGRIVVYHDDQFVCVAKCPEVLGVSRREIAIESRARQKAEIEAARRELRALARKADTRDIVFEYLDRKEREAQTVATLPPPNVVHITPAIEQARASADALDEVPGPVVRPTTLADVEAARDLVRSEQIAEGERPEKEFVWALDMMATPPEEWNDIQRQRLKVYTNSAAFKGRYMIFEEFGPSAFGLSDPKYLTLLPNGSAFDRIRQAQLHGDA
ncbi:MAG TPA: transposase family protein, partial [Acidobacteriaceae bacterium]|nr:transposase family protein [Acidobacteriaceae bacterium]